MAEPDWKSGTGRNGHPQPRLRPVPNFQSGSAAASPATDPLSQAAPQRPPAYPLLDTLPSQTHNAPARGRPAAAGARAGLEGVERVEREIFMSGIGGQGIQVVTKMLAQAANLEGKYVMHFGYYEGSVRGGRSDCTVVIGTEEIQAPPIIERAWGGIAMHPEFYRDLLRKMRPGGLLLYNTSLI